MASKHKQPLLEIDLNIEFTQAHVEDGSTPKEAYNHLPDLNIDAAGDFILDLNVIPSSSMHEMLTPTQPLLDLNQEPSTLCEDNIEYVDVDTENIIGEAENQHNIQTLSNEKRRAIYHTLLEKSDNGKLKKGVTNMVASSFSVSMRTVQRIWKQAKDFGDVNHRKTGNCGRKRVQIDYDRFREIPLAERTTLSSLSNALKISQSTLSKLRKLGDIRHHSNAIKPFLKEENKIARLRFCLSMLEHDGTTHDPVFKSMHNIIHVDEKWFYMTKKSTKYYLVPDEEDPHRTIQSKNFIGKIMFLVALARPRFDPQGNEVFSGKIGVWPFVTQESAKRTSANRVVGTLQTKPITSVTREVTRSFFIEKLIPAIKAKWPRDDLRNPIFVQQDNARPHID
ncbi:uncharacterized protein [Coffea arabica]|uniref:DUF7769 domain-containing protein n=1 Tax=Coffea arabica TaxID=13443 RepID=A0A6P6VJV6_COFAR|nr:uncharacterized protein LOC113724656 [Coffea arabica]